MQVQVGPPAALAGHSTTMQVDVKKGDVKDDVTLPLKPELQLHPVATSIPSLVVGQSTATQAPTYELLKKSSVILSKPLLHEHNEASATRMAFGGQGTYEQASR